VCGLHLRHPSLYIVAYEALWHQAWIQGVKQAKQGLRATLIVKDPKTHALLVNFDKDIMQLIREAKYMIRLNLVVPQSALMVGSGVSTSIVRRPRLS
jgi:dynein heavy chain